MKYGWKIAFTNCQGAVGPLLGSPGSFPHPRGSGLLKASSDVAQQRDLSSGFGEPSNIARNDWEKPHLVFLPRYRASEPYLSSGPDPGGLLCRYAHSTLCSLHPAWLCSPPPGTVAPLGEVPACSPLPQPHCTLTRTNIPSAQLQCPLLPPEPEASNGLCAGV